MSSKNAKAAKAAKVVKQQDDTTTSVMDTSPKAICNSLIGYPTGPQDVVFEIFPNPNKVDSMQPDLLGTCMFGEIEVSLVFWGSKTRDGSRYYYSCAMHDAVKKREAWKSNRGTIPPLHKLHFYEHRQAHSTDPDFATPESFIEAGGVWWGGMWVREPEDPNALDQIRYGVVFSPKPFRPALSAQAKENTANAVARLQKRRRELEVNAFYMAKQAQGQGQLDDEEIPGLG